MEMQAQVNDTRDCVSCKKPAALLPENIAAYELFWLLRSQYTYVGMDAIPVGVSYSVVKDLLDIYEIEDRRICFEKIITLVTLDIREIHKERATTAKKT